MLFFPPVSCMAPYSSHHPCKCCSLIYYFNYLLGCVNNQNFPSLPGAMPGYGRTGGKSWLLPKLCAAPGYCLRYWCFSWGPVGLGLQGTPRSLRGDSEPTQEAVMVEDVCPGQGSEVTSGHLSRTPMESVGRKSSAPFPAEGRKPCAFPYSSH